jgi:hypothetical protein
MYPVYQKVLPTATQAVADCHKRLVVGSMFILFKPVITQDKLFRIYETSEILSVFSLKVIMCTRCASAQPVGVQSTKCFSDHNIRILFSYLDKIVCREVMEMHM